MIQSISKKNHTLHIINCTKIMTHIGLYKNQSINISNHQDGMLEYKGIVLLKQSNNSIGACISLSSLWLLVKVNPRYLIESVICVWNI